MEPSCSLCHRYIFGPGGNTTAWSMGLACCGCTGVGDTAKECEGVRFPGGELTPQGNMRELGK